MDLKRKGSVYVAQFKLLNGQTDGESKLLSSCAERYLRRCINQSRIPEGAKISAKELNGTGRQFFKSRLMHLK